MERTELLDMLERLVREGNLTEQEAGEVLRLWDAGEITSADLPLAPSEGVLGLNEWLALAAVLDILQRFNIIRQAQRVQALAGVLRRAGEAMARQEGAAAVEQTVREAAAYTARLQDIEQRVREAAANTTRLEEVARAGRQRVTVALGNLPASRRDRLSDDLTEIFHEEARSRTSRYLTSGDYDDGLRRWQVAMREASRDDLLRMAQLAKGGPLDADDLNRLREDWMSQQSHLQALSEKIAAKEALGEPLTDKQIANYARMYAGSGRSVYWQTRSREAGYGYLVWFEGYDDGGTCSACLEAQQGSPYAAGTDHPLPGSDTCFGRGHCRDRLRFEYDPDRYEQLIGEGVPA